MLAHNLETVPRVLKRIRPAFRYERSLGVLTRRARSAWTKSNLILGLGGPTTKSCRRWSTCMGRAATC